MLSERRQRVLRALVEDYIEYALPVGSRTLTERHHLGVSPATVRTDLSVLEDAGFIQQPHTSAGRVPTDAGYRAFVDELLSQDLAEENEPHQTMVDELRSTASELDSLLEETSAALARLTDCLSIVMAPSVFSGRIQQITLVSLSPYQAILVVITHDGQVVNRAISFTEEVDAEDLARVQNTLNRLVQGKSAREARRSLNEQAAEMLTNPLMQVIMGEIAECMQESDSNRAHSLGISSLLRQPEFSDARALLPLVEVLEDDEILFHALDETATHNSPLVVRIGSENPASALSSVSLVACPYGRGDGEGVVAVIGPTRMNYPTVIRAVRAAQSVLGHES
jgi:heat-inducible transcriptional repressor